MAGAETAGAEALVVKEVRKEDADDTENGEKNVQEVLAGKIAQLDAKKNEDKGTEKELSRMYKKASKELKEQLDAITSDSEKVKFLQQKFLDKMHQCNAADRKVENMQVRRWCGGTRANGSSSFSSRALLLAGDQGAAGTRVPPRPGGDGVHSLRITEVTRWSVPLISTLQGFEMRGAIHASENIFVLKVATVTIRSALRSSGISRQSCWGVGES